MKIHLFCLSLLMSSLNLPLVMAQTPARAPATMTHKKMLSTSLDNFNSKWSYTGTFVSGQGKAKLHTKLFKRLMWIKQTQVSLVETTFVFLDNPQVQKNSKENELQTIAQNINKSFGNKLTITKKKKNYLIEGEFKKINKYMFVELVAHNNAVAIITSSIRLGLKDNLIPEVEELHKVLGKYNGEPSKKIKKTSYFSSIISSAFAIDFGDLADILNGKNNITNTLTPELGNASDSKLSPFESFENKLDNLGTTVGTLNTTLGTTNENWANTNSQFGGINSNWSNTNSLLLDIGAEIGTNGTALNLNWSESNKTIKELGAEFGTKADDLNKNWNKTNETIDTVAKDLGTKADDLNKNWNKTNETIDNAAKDFANKADDLNKNWADTNKEITRANETADKFADEYKNMNDTWAESNKIMAKAMDPNHMAKVAFYTAAGAALGGIAVNLAVQGVAEGISFLHELFTGAKEKKLEWSDFQKAMDVWDTKLNDLVKMEQLVDGYINAFAFFEEKNLGNDYEKQLNLAMRDMRFDRDLFIEKFKDQDLALECRKLFYDASDELDQQIKSYDKIIQFANNQNLAMGGANYFCAQLKDLQRKILLAETQMQDVRLKILRAENQFYSKEMDVIKGRDKDLEKINKRLPSTIKEKREFEKQMAERLTKKNKVTKKSWLSECMDAKNDEGKKIKEDLKGSFFVISYFKKRSRCSSALVKVESQLLKQDKEQLRSISLEENLRKDLELKQNSQVELSLSQEQINWMSRVHMDAYCYQYTHQTQEGAPSKCAEFPEMLYSLSLARGYDKAKNAYDTKCKERYINGLENLAKTNQLSQ